MGRAVRALPLLILSFSLGGCDQTAADLREWRPQDHDHTTNPGAEQVAGGPDAGPAPELARHGLNEVIIVAWQQNCTRCHGRVGRGDGPQGAMFRTADLSNPAWQDAINDEQIALAIKNGRGAMPPFALPDATIEGLVRLIRLLRADTEPATAASGSPSAAPSAAPSTVPGAARTPR